MRLRALPLLLVLTAADYALWTWSIADGHDVVSLVAGLTLLPLAAATLALIAVGAARLLTFVLERPSARGLESSLQAARGHTTNTDGERRTDTDLGHTTGMNVGPTAARSQARAGSAAPPPTATRPSAETAARERSGRLAA